jgi:S-formylglutathione hydrolase FrmB
MISLNNNYLHAQVINNTNGHFDTSIIVSNTRIDLLFPANNIEGTILVLPGWNFKCDDICKKSNFCQLAKKMGFVLILPDMLKSIYASQLYPETRKDWLSYPTLPWITDTLIQYIRLHYKLLLQEQNNYLFGISTGARGVAMVALYTDTIFKAGAGLSGDYNQLELPEDNLIKGFYGTFKQFPERWSGHDNPRKNAFRLKIPLYLAHGKSDNIVPFTQTLDFYNTISKQNPELGHTIDLNDTAGHNYSFWQSEYLNAINFFEKHKVKK